jgi:heme/copper-type cytochrome/quinol oxidase subunit 2
MFELTPLNIVIMIVVFVLVIGIFAYFIRKELK